jgi:hypothetical protein
VQGLDRLVSVFTARGREPVLIFEDTDAWLLRTDGGHTADAANRFFADSLGVLVRDVDIRIVIATHPGYIKLDGYRSIRERLLTEVEIPSLDKPKDAITRILQNALTSPGSAPPSPRCSPTRASRAWSPSTTTADTASATC